MNLVRSIGAIALLACISGLSPATPARAQESDAQRRLDALEAENARLRKDLHEAARHLREAADVLERAAGGHAESSPAATSEAPAPVPPTPKPEADAEPPIVVRYDGFLVPLAAAHRARDDAKIEEAEKAVIAKGAAARAIVETAFEKDKQFNMKVSLQYILLALDGKAGVRDVIAAMHATKDPGEKMRLAFMLQKPHAPGDTPFLVDATQSEQDPMIKKYLVRALGESTGADGLAALEKVARSDEDRNLRIEAVRAIEEKAVTETARFLMDLAAHEEDASIKAITIRALANTAGHDAFDYFKAMLDISERTNNRAEAVKYFGRVGTKEDLATIRVVYKAETVYYIKQKLKQALDSIDEREGLPAEPQ